MTTSILNIHEYARHLKYVVARYVSGSWWFWGAWDDKHEADRIALEINGAVFDMEDI